jgi:wyosine [tRNA(Phe)-imidazoG37] synthetase (radical SAM superfamily)
MTYNYLFGPVPSRRLGISLGIDLVPMKTCSLNCIYCECGRTTHLTVARKEYTPFKAVQSELFHILGLHVNEINKYLDVLEADRKIYTEKQQRGIFYRAAIGTPDPERTGE